MRRDVGSSGRARSGRLVVVLVTVVIVVVLLAVFAVGVPPLVRAAVNLRARILGRRGH